MKFYMYVVHEENKQMAKNSEQKTILLRSYGIKKVTNHEVIKTLLIMIQAETQRSIESAR